MGQGSAEMKMRRPQGGGGGRRETLAQGGGGAAFWVRCSQGGGGPSPRTPGSQGGGGDPAYAFAANKAAMSDAATPGRRRGSPRNAGPGRRRGRVWGAVSAREEEGFHREHRGLREEEETRRNRVPQMGRLCCLRRPQGGGGGRRYPLVTRGGGSGSGVTLGDIPREEEKGMSPVPTTGRRRWSGIRILTGPSRMRLRVPGG